MPGDGNRKALVELARSRLEADHDDAWQTISEPAVNGYLNSTDDHVASQVQQFFTPNTDPVLDTAQIVS